MKFCKHCGKQQGADTRFCGGCGTVLDDQEATSQPTEQPMNQSMGYPPPENGASPDKNKMIAIGIGCCAVLALFFFVQSGDSSSSSSSSNSGSSSSSDIIPDHGIKAVRDLTDYDITSVASKLENGVWAETYLGNEQYKVTLTGYAPPYGEDVVFTFDLRGVDPTGRNHYVSAECDMSIYLKTSGIYLNDVLSVTRFFQQMS